MPCQARAASPCTAPAGRRCYAASRRKASSGPTGLKLEERKQVQRTPDEEIAGEAGTAMDGVLQTAAAAEAESRQSKAPSLQQGLRHSSGGPKVWKRWIAPSRWEAAVRNLPSNKTDQSQIPLNLF